MELIIDCNRVPYEMPVIDDYEYVIDQTDPWLDISLPPTMCGPWIYE